MDRGKSGMTRGAKSKIAQHPADLFALGSKSSHDSSDSKRTNIIHNKAGTSSSSSKYLFFRFKINFFIYYCFTQLKILMLNYIYLKLTFKNIFILFNKKYYEINSEKSKKLLLLFLNLLNKAILKFTDKCNFY